jgi:hypothetical protein
MRAYAVASRYTFPILAIAVAIAAGYIGGTGNDTGPTRAVMFGIVSLLFASELASMVARTRRDQWDGLAISMAFARFAIVHYFASLALDFGGVVSFPTPYWTIARSMLGIFGGIALVFMIREDIRAFREMSKGRRLAAFALLAGIGVMYVSFALVW